MGDIRKTKVVLTFLHNSDYSIEGTPVEDLLVDADMGPIIAGSPEVLSTEEVPDEAVKDELLAIGNDGTFFDPIGDDWISEETGE